ncbi:MAG: hypothetical protein CXT68_04745 [Methanobacteriota archaeon]|nr:MAG: hypothetical protein CXT68_04745 [Euryarchaeota archaeon]
MSVGNFAIYYKKFHHIYFIFKDYYRSKKLQVRLKNGNMRSIFLYLHKEEMKQDDEYLYLW